MAVSLRNDQTKTDYTVAVAKPACLNAVPLTQAELAESRQLRSRRRRVPRQRGGAEPRHLAGAGINAHLPDPAVGRQRDRRRCRALGGEGAASTRASRGESKAGRRAERIAARVARLRRTPNGKAHHVTTRICGTLGLAATLLLAIATARAEDIDIFGDIPTDGVKPNILIVLDTAASNDADFRSTCPIAGIHGAKLMDQVQCAIAVAGTRLRSPAVARRQDQSRPDDLRPAEQPGRALGRPDLRAGQPAARWTKPASTAWCRSSPRATPRATAAPPAA